MPVETSLPAAGFKCKFFLENVHSVRFVARTSHILDVEEGCNTNVPDGCCHHQRQQPAAEEGHISTEQRVRQEEKGCEQQQSPTPGQFDEVTAGDKKIFRRLPLVKIML